MARLRFLVLENNWVHLFYFWVLSPGLVAASCATHEMLTEIKANVLVRGQHHLLQVPWHQRDRVEQGVVSVEPAHWLRLLQLHRNWHLLIQECLIWRVWTEITAFRAVDLSSPLLV